MVTKQFLEIISGLCTPQGPIQKGIFAIFEQMGSERPCFGMATGIQIHPC